MINRYWGVEMDYVYFGTYDDHYLGSPFKTAFTAWGPSVKGTYQFSGSRFSIYGKAGMNQIQIKTTSSTSGLESTTTKFGFGAAAGMGYALAKKVTLSAELNILSFTARTSTTTNNVNYALILYGVGLQYQF